MVEYKKRESQTIFGLRTSALAEAVVIFLILLAWDWLFAGSTRFIENYPHPFWIPVLLITAQYGTSEGLATAALATIFLYFRNIPMQLVDETTFDYQYRLALRPFLWFSTVFILGELRMRLQRQIDYLTQKSEKAIEHAKTIANNYEVLKGMKENLESRLAGQISTVAAAYETVRGLESLRPVQILMTLDKIVHTTLTPKKFSVFASGPHGLEATTSHGWTEQDSFLRRFTCDHPLYKEIVQKKRIVCLVNQEDEQILGAQGVIAGPLIERGSNEVFGMIKIEEIDFFKLDISNLETFKTLCELIGSAYSNAKKYKMAMANAIYEEEVGIFSGKLYDLLELYLKDLCFKMDIPLSRLTIKLQQTSTPKEEEMAIISEIYNLITAEIPVGTAIFQGKEKFTYQILLTNMTRSHAEKLAMSILDVILKHPILSKYKFIFHSESIYEPKGRETLAP